MKFYRGMPLPDKYCYLTRFGRNEITVDKLPEPYNRGLREGILRFIKHLYICNNEEPNPCSMV